MLDALGKPRLLNGAQRTLNVVKFPTAEGLMRSRENQLPVPFVPANDAGMDLDPALIRGLLRWETATLMDGRVVLDVLLDVPGQSPERRQIVLHRTVADELGRDCLAMATALHQPE